ncbi:cation:proton antiporter [Salinispirillum sp. LH 10-3-1]|uniref:Cation:proton antiporter n=1 Tax=Salinispirillum sp. LH 10-3-1 TaxID=2952525 RepID=A0AB38YED0_9GAMM
MDALSFSLFVALVLAGGWAASRLAQTARLPGILGMLVFGLLWGIFALDAVPPLAWDIEPFIKGLALIIILLRAGLGLRRRVLAKVGRTALLLAVIPCTLEALALMPLLHLIFGLDWLVAGLAAWMLAAVSPAVVVPTMLKLQAEGHGQKNHLPAMVLAGASVDDVIAITFFAAFLVMVSSAGTSPDGLNSALGTLGLVPLSVLGGILLGAAVGLALAWWLQRHYEKIRATDKAMLIVMVSIVVVALGDWLSLASLLAVMTIGIILLERAEPVANEVAVKLAKFWIPAEIALFVFIGLQVNPSVALETGLLGVLVIVGGLLARTLGVLIATGLDARLSWLERWFCAAAYVPKATVQAALGAVPLSLGIAGGEVILSLAVIAILFTAPLGLMLIRHLGPRLP